QDEPRPPRRLNKAIPAELEIIVLKALAKAPADRYQTAQELADDLRRFLEDRPIQARRPTLWQQARRLARRHQPGGWSAVAVLAIAVLLLAGTLGWVARDQAATQALAEQKADAALTEARELQQRRQWAEAETSLKHARGLLRPGTANVALERRLSELEADL